MKVKLKIVKRNPFVALAIRRKAGSHKKTEKSVRRAQTVAVSKCYQQINRNELI